MRFGTVLLVLPLLLCATSALAQPAIRIGWGDSLGGGMDAADACENNQTPGTIVCSFWAPPELSALYELEATLDFCTLPFTLPPWWGGPGSENCSPAALSASADFTEGPFSAIDYWNGQATAEMTFQTPVEGNDVRARVVITIALDPALATELVPGQVYYGFKFIVDGRNATCSGCSTPTCFVVNGLTLTGPEGEVRFYGPYSDVYASWSGANEGCPFIVADRVETFGTLKARFDGSGADQ